MSTTSFWNGLPTDSHKTKVALEEVCKPTNEGGMRIRRLQDVSLIYELSLIWRLLHAQARYGLLG